MMTKSNLLTHPQTISCHALVWWGYGIDQMDVGRRVLNVALEIIDPFRHSFLQSQRILHTL